MANKSSEEKPIPKKEFAKDPSDLFKDADVYCGSDTECKRVVVDNYKDYVEYQVEQQKRRADEETKTLERIKANERAKSSINLVYTILKWVMFLTFIGLLLYTFITFIMALFNPESAPAWILALFAGILGGGSS